jgi:hypothetical protein
MANEFGPRIVSSELVLALDAADINSYDKYENLLAYSDQFNTAFWTKTGISVTANATTSPDGFTSADLLTEDTSTSAHWIYYSPTPTPFTANTYTLSVFAKQAVGSRYLRFSGFGLDGVSESPIFDISSGIIYSPPTTTRFKSASIIPYPNGWYRCVCTIQHELTIGQRPLFRLTNSTTNFGNYTYTGDGTSGIYLWGAQLEYGSSVTNYYPVTTTAKTRGTTWTDLTGNSNSGTLTNGPTYNSSNAGSLVFDGSNDYIVLNNTNIGNFGTNNFTVSIWCKPASGSAGSRGVISKYEPHSSNGSGWFMFNTDGQIFTRITQDISAPLESSEITASVSGNAWYNFTITRDTNKFSLFINGQLYQQNTTTNIINCSNSSTTLSIGSGYRYTSGATGYYYSGNVSSTLIYDKALTATEVQQNFNALRSRFGV